MLPLFRTADVVTTPRYVTCHHQEYHIKVVNPARAITNILFSIRHNTLLATMSDECYYETQFTQINQRFVHACRQVTLVNNEIEALKVRHERAERNNERAFSYSQRLRLIVLENTRAMFYEYATACSDRLASLHDELLLSERFFSEPTYVPKRCVATRYGFTYMPNQKCN